MAAKKNVAKCAPKKPRKRKLLTQKEIASYQLALRCIRWMEREAGLWRGAFSSRPEKVHALAKEIRTYRREEQQTN